MPKRVVKGKKAAGTTPMRWKEIPFKEAQAWAEQLGYKLTTDDAWSGVCYLIEKDGETQVTDDYQMVMGFLNTQAYEQRA